MSTQKIVNMHLIEVVDNDRQTYQFPVAAVEDMPRQEWFDLMVECGGHVDCSSRELVGDDTCLICEVVSARIAAAEAKSVPEDNVTKELLDWLDQGASEAMRFRELLLKRGV